MSEATRGIIRLEIDNILSEDNPSKAILPYTVTLHTKENDIVIERLVSIELLRDYNENIGDYILITFQMVAGEFMELVQPYHDNLEMTLQSKTTTRYKLLLRNNREGMESSMLSRFDREELNKLSILNIEGQLVLRELEGLRNTFVDGIYRTVTVKELIEGLYFDSASKVILEGTPLDINIDVVEPNNDITLQNHIIPTGISVLDLASYLQSVSPGVYNGAIGTYIQKYLYNEDSEDKFTVFVYPLYSAQLYTESSKPKVIFYFSNTHILNLVERTYSIEDDVIKIIVGTEVENFDNTNVDISSKGESIIATTPENILNRNIEIGEEDITYDKTKQLKGISLKKRSDGYVKSRMVINESNLYYQRSKLIRDTMIVYRIPWRYSNPDLIYPGMPCCYIFESSKGELVKQNGTIQLVFSRYDAQTNSWTTTLMVMVSKFYTEEENG